MRTSACRPSERSAQPRANILFPSRAGPDVRDQAEQDGRPPASVTAARRAAGVCAAPPSRCAALYTASRAPGAATPRVMRVQRIQPWARGNRGEQGRGTGRCCDVPSGRPRSDDVRSRSGGAAVDTDVVCRQPPQCRRRRRRRARARRTTSSAAAIASTARRRSEEATTGLERGTRAGWRRQQTGAREGGSSWTDRRWCEERGRLVIP